MPKALSTGRGLQELEAEKKKLEIEHRLLQIELQLLETNQEINVIRLSQTPRPVAQSVETSSIKIEESVLIIDDHNPETRQNSSQQHTESTMSLQMPKTEQSDGTHGPFVSLHMPTASNPSTAGGSNVSGAGQQAPSRRVNDVPTRFEHSLASKRSNALISQPGPEPVSGEYLTEPHRSLQQKPLPAGDSSRRHLALQRKNAVSQSQAIPSRSEVATERPNPFLMSPSPPVQTHMRAQKRKQSSSPEAPAGRPPKQLVTKKYDERSSSITSVLGTNIAGDTSTSEPSRSPPSREKSGTPAIIIDTEISRPQRPRRIPQGGYETPEYRRLTVAEKHHLELRYCAHILTMIQHKSCIRKPPVPLSKENLLDRSRRRFPPEVLDTEVHIQPRTLSKQRHQQHNVFKAPTLTCSSAAPSASSSSFLLLSQDGQTNVHGEPFYRTGMDFLDHVKSMLRDYVRMGPCDNCPFAREGGRQSARVMCWRMRLESVVEERMRGLKTCMKRCDELAGDLEQRRQVVDEWFAGWTDDDEE